MTERITMGTYRDVVMHVNEQGVFSGRIVGGELLVANTLKTLKQKIDEVLGADRPFEPFDVLIASGRDEAKIARVMRWDKRSRCFVTTAGETDSSYKVFYQPDETVMAAWNALNAEEREADRGFRERRDALRAKMVPIDRQARMPQ